MRNQIPTTMAPAPTGSPGSAVAPATFQVLSNVSEVLTAVLQGADGAAVGPLRARFAECERALDGLAGGGLTRAEQEKVIEGLRAGLRERRACVDRYRALDVLREVTGVDAEEGRTETGADRGGEE